MSLYFCVVSSFNYALASDGAELLDALPIFKYFRSLWVIPVLIAIGSFLLALLNLYIVDNRDAGFRFVGLSIFCIFCSFLCWRILN